MQILDKYANSSEKNNIHKIIALLIKMKFLFIATKLASDKI